MSQIAYLNNKGHTAVEWEKSDPVSTEKARMTFDQFIEQGFVTFKAVATGPAEQIRTFDPSADTIFVLRQFVGG